MKFQFNLPWWNFKFVHIIVILLLHCFCLSNEMESLLKAWRAKGILQTTMFIIFRKISTTSASQTSKTAFVFIWTTTYDWKGLMIRVSPTSTCVQFFRKYILWHNWYKVVVLQKCKKLWRITFYNWRSYYSENKFENWLRKNILDWDCVT